MEAAKTNEQAEQQPAELLLRLKFNGPVTEEQLDHFTELVDKEMGHVHDAASQRVYPKSDNINGGWGMGSSMVMDVERVVG